MSRHSSPQLSVREQRRAVRSLSHKRERMRARWRKGQTLVIFVLSFTVLLGLAGLSIDAARAFDLYGRMQRAAEAGALAAVLYMPNYYNTNYTDGNTAIKRALQETVKSGFGSSTLASLPATIPANYFGCPNPSTSFDVAVCQSPTVTNDVQVYVTQTLNLVLLSGLGITPITLRAVAQADYAPPIQLNGRYNFVGDQIECSPGNSENSNSSYCATGVANGNRLSYYWMAMSGPGQLQETGDPYVYCSEGKTEYIPTPGGNPSPDPNLGSDTATTYNGLATDHPQQSGTVLGSNISQYCGKPSPGGNPGNPDYQPDGYAGYAASSGASTLHVGGYNYQLNVQPNTGNINVWIYNPYFIPGSAANTDQFNDNALSTFYRGFDGNGITNFDNGAGCATPPCGHYDAPYFYFTTYVSIYQTKELYDRTSDVLVAHQTFQPYDAMPQDLAAHGCSSGQVLDVTSTQVATANWYHNRATIVTTPGANGCVTPPACAPATSTSVSTWCKVQVNDLGGGDAILPDNTLYRVVIETVGLTSTATNLLDARGFDYKATEVSGFGQHDYGLKGCLATATGPYGNTGCGIGAKGVGQFNQPYITFYGWNNFDLGFNLPLGTSNPSPNYPQTACVTSNATPYGCIDFVCIPTEFAGRTISVRIYNPGESQNGDLYLGIVPPNPSLATVSYSSYGTSITTTTLDGDFVIQTRYSTGYAGYRPFRGLWLSAAITFSPNYVGDCALTRKVRNANGFWQIAYMSPNATAAGLPNMSMTISTTLVGSPQHLVTVG